MVYECLVYLELENGLECELAVFLDDLRFLS